MPGLGTSECPVSTIDSWSKAALDLHYRAKALHKTLPNVLGNGDELPAKLVEALETIAIEETRVDIRFAEARRARERQQRREFE